MMDRDSALSSLETINTVINRTRRELSSDWPYLIWTGGLLILACLVEQWLWLRKVPHALPHLMVWGVFCLLVALGSLAIGRYMERHRGGRIADGLGRKIYAIWGAITAVVLFLVYLALGPKLFNPIHIWVLAMLLDTLGLFIRESSHPAAALSSSACWDYPWCCSWWGIRYGSPRSSASISAAAKP